MPKAKTPEQLALFYATATGRAVAVIEGLLDAIHAKGVAKKTFEKIAVARANEFLKMYRD